MLYSINAILARETIVKMLINNKADVNAKDRNESTSLHYVAENGNIIPLVFE